jgi:hypothetical protein
MSVMRLRSSQECKELTQSVRLVKSQSVSNNDLVSALISPNVHLVVDSRTTLQTTTPVPMLRHQRLPSTDDLHRWTSEFRPTKRMMYEPPSDRTKTVNSPLPKITLAKVRAGVNPGKKWFAEKEKLSLFEDGWKGGYRARMKRDDSFRKIFPSSSLDFDHLPEESSDSALASYSVNATNVFKSACIKHPKFRHRRIDPRQHPEYVSEGSGHRKIRDRVVTYREAMVRIRPLVQGTNGQLLS